jgi:transposase InsO family protein
VSTRRGRVGVVGGRRSIEPDQYTSIRYTDRLAEIGAVLSIDTIGDSYDDAMAETTIGLYKAELVWRRGPWRTAEDLELATRVADDAAGFEDVDHRERRH